MPAGRELSIDDGGIYYDFNRWKMESFAAWHEWMASIVKELWPGMPVHSKIMMGGSFSNSSFVKEGIDPELFSKFCDLNGNDDYFIVDRPSTGAWQVTAMGYALQASLRPVHIVNAENHIISDRFDGDIPYGRIYSSLFQQFIKGCAGSMIWVWEDSNYKDTLKKGDFVGSIYRRPAAILAAADAGADANRIAPEIKEIFNAKPQVAILYSQASNIMDPVYGKRVADIFGALAFNGRKTAFISERQAQAGSFGGLKAIFIANASHVEPATLKALEAFQSSGGKLFSIGDSLSKDVYGKPLKSQLKTQALDKSLRGADLANLVGSVSDEALGKLPVRISSSSKSGLLHVDWQAVKSADGSWLLCVVNYNSEPLDVALEAPEGAKALDIVRLKETGRALVLEPWRPLVLRVK